MSPPRLFATLLIAPALFLAAGCGPLPMSAAIQTPEICKTFPAATVPGDPAGGSGSFDTDTTVDVSSEIASLTQQGLSVHLTVTSVSVTPVSGIQDFGFLDSARLDVISSASPSSLVAYQRDPQAAPPTQLTLEPSSKVDLADGWWTARRASPFTSAEPSPPPIGAWR